MKARLLIVDDEAPLRRALARSLRREGYEVNEAEDGERALLLLEQGEYEVVLLDLRMPGRPGLEVLREIKQRWPLTEVIVLTGHGSIDAAIEAIKQGACDFQQKPFRLEVVEAALEQALRSRRLAQRTQAFAEPELRGMEWGSSSAMRAVQRDLERVAPTPVSVLILGESGVGKELLARELHQRSARAGGPFVPINCAAIPSNLAESILFGHERGAFSGATRRKLGLAEVAHGGTLFLDELGELPYECQTKLLRFLQFGEVLRVGATEPARVDARIVAATNRDIDAAVAEGDFRDDLLHRVDTVRLTLPPLRERPGDIERLVRRFLLELAPGREVSCEPAALELLSAHLWPGNVRELRKVIQRLLILGEGDQIRAAEVRRHLKPPSATTSNPRSRGVRSLKDAERDAVAAAIAASETRADAAESLGVSLRTLYNKIRAYGLE